MGLFRAVGFSKQSSVLNNNLPQCLSRFGVYKCFDIRKVSFGFLNRPRAAHELGLRYLLLNSSASCRKQRGFSAGKGTGSFRAHPRGACRAQTFILHPPHSPQGREEAAQPWQCLHLPAGSSPEPQGTGTDTPNFCPRLSDQLGPDAPLPLPPSSLA